MYASKPLPCDLSRHAFTATDAFLGTALFPRACYLQFDHGQSPGGSTNPRR
jgi:hypothetical protein